MEWGAPGAFSVFFVDGGSAVVYVLLMFFYLCFALVWLIFFRLVLPIC
jgi:hypothetical protein